MFSDPFLPEWLEKLRLPDELISQAYEDIPAPYRSALKTGISLAHFHFGSPSSTINCSRGDRFLGFERQEHSAPVDWTVLVISATQKGAAPVCAAAILPVLAGVEKIAVLCIGHPRETGVLLSLDLCGLNDIFVVDEAQCLNAIEQLNISSNTGRIVFLNCGEIGHSLWQAKCPQPSVINLVYKPMLLMPYPAPFNLEQLEFCTGMRPETDPLLSPYWDAAYLSDIDIPKDINARLKLHAGCEGFWLYAGMHPNLFRKCRYDFKAFL